MLGSNHRRSQTNRVSLSHGLHTPPFLPPSDQPTEFPLLSFNYSFFAVISRMLITQFCSLSHFLKHSRRSNKTVGDIYRPPPTPLLVSKLRFTTNTPAAEGQECPGDQRFPTPPATCVILPGLHSISNLVSVRKHRTDGDSNAPLGVLAQPEPPGGG